VRFFFLEPLGEAVRGKQLLSGMVCEVSSKGPSSYPVLALLGHGSETDVGTESSIGH
jgi:hypothetical protein